MMVDRLNPLDVWFLHLEDQADMLHIGSLLIFEGPAPPWGEVQAAYTARLAGVPRFRQVVRRVPLGLNRPVWVEDPHFNLDYHLRHTALPTPGGEEELRNLVGRVMGQRLDRHRPLWETWMVEGLEDGRWAILSKIHHCMVDGIAGTVLTEAFLDDPPESRDGREPPAAPAARDLVRDALRDHAHTAGDLVTGTAEALRHPARAGRYLGALAKGTATLAGMVHRVPPSSISGPITPHRRWDWARGDLEQVKAIKVGLGGTVNDVVLAAVTKGFGDLLAARDEPDAVVRALIPVSTRNSDDRDQDNRVAALFATLPTGETDPLERYRAVQAEMATLKQSGEALVAAALVQASGLAPSALLGPAMHLTTKAVNRVGQRNANTVVTNVPGPQHPLSFLGRRLQEWMPYVPIAEAVRIGVAVLSYNGQLRFGVTADYNQRDDLSLLTAGIEAALTELAELAELAAA